jgi:hypothetical protein
LVSRSYIGGMQLGRLLIVGKPSGRQRHGAWRDSAREKAVDFYEIEPALLRVVAIELDSAKVNPRIISIGVT